MRIRFLAWRTGMWGLLGVLLAAGALLPVHSASAVGLPTFSVGDGSLVEGDSGFRQVKIPITLSAAVGVTTTINYTVSAGTATAGTDFLPLTNKKLTFKPGIVKKTIAVKVYGDAADEGDETMVVTLLTPTGGTDTLRAAGTGTIIDDDPIVGATVDIGDVAVVEGDSGGGVAGTVAQFTVTLSELSLANVTVQYATAAGTASAGSDFTSIPTKTLTFKPGVVKKYVTVKVTRDTSAEANEVFTVGLANAVGVGFGLGRSTGTGTILDDDVPGAPVIAGTTPTSPAASTTPLVFGTTGPNAATVSLYSDSACAGPVQGSGSAAAFTGAGLSVTVPAGTTTTIYAQVSSTLGLLSACSTGFAYSSSAPTLTGFGWGRNDGGNAGIGTFSAPGTGVLTPTSIMADASVVATTGFSSAAVRSDGTLWTWGQNGFHGLGDGSFGDRAVPTQVGTDTDWSALAGGWNFMLALKADGSLWAWGINAFGQLGDGTGTDRPTPTHIGTDTWTEIGAGSFHSVAVRSDGTLWAWGANNVGQVGDGTTTNRFAPVQVGSDSDWTAVDAAEHSMALKSDGTLWAFGWNYKGQLGDGTFTNSAVPVQVGVDSDWASINAGGWASSAIKTDGTLWTWGDNAFGTLGISGPGLSQTPLQVGTDTDWAQVSSSTCTEPTPVLAIKSGGSLWGWGSNDFGQLGVGSAYGVQATPVQVGTSINWSTVVAGCEHSLGIQG